MKPEFMQTIQARKDAAMDDLDRSLAWEKDVALYGRNLMHLAWEEYGHEQALLRGTLLKLCEDKKWDK